MNKDSQLQNKDDLPKTGEQPTPPSKTEQPFTVRFGRLLAGHPLDEPINDPANPNLITSRRE